MPERDFDVESDRALERSQSRERGLRGRGIGFTREDFLIRASALGIGATGLGALLSACGGDDEAAKTGEQVPGSAEGGDSIVLAVFQEPDSLDPGAMALITSYQVTQSMFDQLIYQIPGEDAGAQKFYPGLAESFEASEDATRFTFTLRRDVVFHDGTPFNADAVKASFDHIVDPATKSTNAIAHLGPYSETRVIDEYTAEIVFEGPNSPFFSIMTEQLMAISSPAALEEYGSEYGRNPVGTGPFMFKEWVDGQHVTVTRNPDYRWGPAPLGRTGAALPQEVTFRILPDRSAQANALSTGEVTIAQTLNPEDIVRLEDSDFRRWTAQGIGYPFVVPINTQRPPTDDVRVRQALNYAVDQQAIVDTLFAGLFEPAVSVYDPATEGFDAETQDLYPYDPARAIQLLEEAGWAAGSGGVRESNGQRLTLRMVNIAGEGFEGISQLIQAQLREVGAEVEIENVNWPAVAELYQQSGHHLGNSWDWNASPYFTYNTFGCDFGETGFNFSHYCNRDVEQLIREATAVAEESERQEAWRRVGVALMEDAVVIPIYNKQGIFVAPGDLEGLAFAIPGVPLFNNVTI